MNLHSRGAYSGQTALLATMHGKERVIAPVLERALGLRLRVTHGLDTDRFGTFSREVERTGSPLDAARAKIEAAFALAPEARIAIASEGSFGLDPWRPDIPPAREIVVLRDRASGLEIIGRHASGDTNFSHAIVATVAEAFRFAEGVGFPGHGVIVMGVEDGKATPSTALAKDIVYGADLERAVRAAIERCGLAHIESDMRAHRNPTRMRSIALATEDLVRRG